MMPEDINMHIPPPITSVLVDCPWRSNPLLPLLRYWFSWLCVLHTVMSVFTQFSLWSSIRIALWTNLCTFAVLTPVSCTKN